MDGIKTEDMGKGAFSYAKVTKQTISSVCRGVPLQYNLQLVENAVKAAEGSGAENEEKVRWLIITIRGGDHNIGGHSLFVYHTGKP